MGCTYFGPYDPQKQPPDTIPRWVASCESSGGKFPKACLGPDGTYDLWCCEDAGDYPCNSAPKHGGPVICLPGDAAAELAELGAIALFDGRGSIRLARRRKEQRPED